MEFKKILYIIPLLAFGYPTYEFIKNTTIDPFFYNFIIGLVSYSVIVILFFLINSDIEYSYRSQLKEIIKFMPLLLFIIFIIYIYMIYLKIELPTFTDVIYYFKIIMIDLFFIYIMSIILRYIIKHKFKTFDQCIEYITNSNTNDKFIFLKIVVVIGILMFLFLSWFALFNWLLSLPYLQGDIIIDMESIYYKNDTEIPVLVKVTGPDTKLLVTFRENSDNELYNATIYLDPKESIKLISNGSLIGKVSSSGKYNIFINTSNLTAGYYELRCERLKYVESYMSKTFILKY